MSQPTHSHHTDSHTSQRRELELFLLRLMLFALPILLAAIPAFTILVWSGEAFRDLRPTLQQSLKNNRGLIGFAWNEQNYPWMKHQALLMLPRQNVLAVGSSRVLQFRREMFVCPFGNAGYSILTTSDFSTFLSLLPADRRPQTLLIALDQWMFNSAWIAANGNTSTDRWTQNPSHDLRTGLRLLPDVLADVARRRIEISPLLQHRPDAPWGLNAWQNAKGFRPDGSFAYGRQVYPIHRLLTVCKSCCGPAQNSTSTSSPSCRHSQTPLATHCKNQVGTSTSNNCPLHSVRSSAAPATNSTASQISPASEPTTAKPSMDSTPEKKLRSDNCSICCSRDPD